jgi:hypothetical protein
MPASSGPDSGFSEYGGGERHCAERHAETVTAQQQLDYPPEPPTTRCTNANLQWIPPQLTQLANAVPDSGVSMTAAGAQMRGDRSPLRKSSTVRGVSRTRLPDGRTGKDTLQKCVAVAHLLSRRNDHPPLCDASEDASRESGEPWPASSRLAQRPSTLPRPVKYERVLSRPGHAFLENGRNRTACGLRHCELPLRVNRRT